MSFARGAACLAAAALAPWPAAASISVRLPAPGAELYSASRACLAKVLEDPPGRSLRARLYARGRLVRDVRDAREMAWIGEALVFAVGPVRGDPGIYVWECPRAVVHRVVTPSRSSEAHPRGTDVYQLEKIDGDMLYYAHAPDVDSPSLERDLERGREVLRLGPPQPELSMR